MYLIVPAFVGLLNLNKFSNKSFPVIQEYLISYEFGFVRRVFLELYSIYFQMIFLASLIYTSQLLYF